MRPPEKLQQVIVFASGGVGAAFLIPMAAALFWRRANGAGIIAGMLGGTVTHLFLYATGWQPLSLHPFVWDQVGAALALGVATFLAPPPERELVERFFSKGDAS